MKINPEKDSASSLEDRKIRFHVFHAMHLCDHSFLFKRVEKE